MNRKFIFALGAIASFSLANAASISPVEPSLDEDSGCLLISSAEELYGFAEYVNTNKEHRSVCAKLTKDITVNEDVFDSTGELTSDTEDLAVWTPIMNYEGQFDGQGHTISGLYINNDKIDTVGLFGSISKGTSEKPTSIKKVGVRNSYLKGGQYAGGIVGFLRSDTHALLDEVYVYTNGVIVCDSSCGGLIGYSKSSTVAISNSYFKGEVKGQILAAGFVGYVSGSINISDSYSIGTISSEETAEALVAHIKSDAKSTVENTYILDTFKGTDADVKGAIKATLNEFKNGAVALKLRHYKDESVWGQKIKSNISPTLSGEIKNATISSLTFNTYEGDKTEYIPKYIEGVETTLPTPTRTGYSFEGWYKSEKFEGDAIEKISEKTKGDLTLYAKWALNECELKLSVNDTTMGSVYGMSKVACGALVTFKATAKDGYKFSKWNDDSTSAIRTITVISDTSFKATFKALSSSSSSKAKSSSSSAKAKSSSSSAKSSSSSSKKVSSSSSKAKSSSSSATPKSSSSSAKSSSSKRSIKDIKVVSVTPFVPPTLDDCYQIGTVEELYGFAAIVNGTDGNEKNVSACGELTKSIVVNKNVLDKYDALNLDRTEIISWNPIKGFKGKFDGKGFRISGLYVNKDDKDSVGFFGTVTGGSEEDPVLIQNFGIEDSYFNGENYVGSIIGAVVDAHVKLSQVFNRGSVDGYNNVGGLIGAGVIDSKNDSLTKYTMVINNAFNTGLIDASFTSGGLIGIVGESITIRNVYNYSSVNGSEHTDILVGYNFVGINVSMTNAFYPDIYKSRYGGDPIDVADFENGELLTQLSNFVGRGVNGSAWGTVKGTKLPGFPNADDKIVDENNDEDAIVTTAQAQHFNVLIQGRNVQIMGIRAGEKVIIADIQGHIISKETSALNNFAIMLPHTGAYIIRIGNDVKSITVR